MTASVVPELDGERVVTIARTARMAPLQRSASACEAGEGSLPRPSQMPAGEARGDIVKAGVVQQPTRSENVVAPRSGCPSARMQSHLRPKQDLVQVGHILHAVNKVIAILDCPILYYCYIGAKFKSGSVHPELSHMLHGAIQQDSSRRPPMEAQPVADAGQQQHSLTACRRGGGGGRCTAFGACR
jgi:hypothetical protein